MTHGELLIALSAHDLEITRTERALDELPEKTAILKLRRRLKEIEDLLAKAEAYAHRADQHVARSQDETSAVQDKIDAEQAKVLSGAVTNPKELQNLTREIAALGRRKDALDHETLSLMEKAEQGREQVGKVEATLAEGRARETELIARFRERGGEIQRDIERLKAERALLLERLPADLVARYESVRAAKHGIAVGELNGDVCSACRTQLPASRAQGIAAGPELAECPNCRRILVVRREGGL